MGRHTTSAVIELEIHRAARPLGVRIPRPPPLLKHLHRTQFPEQAVNGALLGPFLGYVRVLRSARGTAVVHRSPTAFETLRTERGTDLAIDHLEVSILRGAPNQSTG